MNIGDKIPEILGAYITKAGEAIDLVNRNKAHVEALRTNGAHVTGTVEFTQKVNVISPDEMACAFDSSTYSGAYPPSFKA